jgi:hypothetical protein
MPHIVLSTLRQAGLLRWLLLAFTLMLMLAAPFAFVFIGMQTTGWRFFLAEVVPALVPSMFFVYPLDMTMCRVKMDGADTQAKRHHKRMIAFNFYQMVFLFVAWLPFFLALFKR